MSSTSSASPTLIDDSPVGSGWDLCQLYIWAANVSSATRQLTIVYGSTEVIQDLPSHQGFQLVVSGIPVLGSLKVSAYADLADSVKIALARRRIESSSELVV